MLVEIAIADAYGAGFEYTRPHASRPNLGESYVAHPTHKEVLPGKYTDDTQATLAIVECLLNNKVSKKDFADSMVTAFQRDPRAGYARGYQKFLESIQSGDEFLEKILPNSDKSGGAMRAGPIGLLPNIKDVLKLSKIQASVTHDTRNGILSAQGAALMVHHQAYNLGPIDDLPRFLDHYANGLMWLSPHVGEAGPKGEQIVRAALNVLLTSKSLKEVLINSVEGGGDTDTVAVIAMACASVSRYYKRDIPNKLYTSLEKGRYGFPYIEGMDKRLSKAFNLSFLYNKFENPANNQSR